MNLAYLLQRVGRAQPTAAALARGKTIVADYGILAGRVAVLAGSLARRYALAPGARVALAMPNCPDFVEILYACWHAGLAAVPMNAKLHPDELAFMLENSGASLCFASPAIAASLSGHASGLAELKGVIEIGSNDYVRLMEGEPVSMVARAPDDLAWLFYTSGTTGRPKGAMLSHCNLMAMALSYFVDVDHIAPGDSILHAAPMSHGSGLYIVPHIMAGALHIIPESGAFEPDEIFELLGAHHGVTLFFAPTMVKRLVDSAAPADGQAGGLKTIVYGGGPMYVDDLHQAMARFGNVFVQIYGQGESPMTITALTRDHHADRTHSHYAERLASVGRAQSVVEVKIADDRDRGLPNGELGEVLVRGDSVMAGYWQNPEATAETLRGGWLHTGDMGVMDEAGFLTLKDRSKDVIISGGANIYPREIEEVLQSHDAIVESAVVGRPHPDWGEEVIAFVVKRPGAALSPDELDRLCLAQIARFKRPRHYRFVESLPKNSYGKILKTELRTLVGEAETRER